MRRLCVLLALLYAALLLPSTAVADIIIEPLKFEWPDAKEPPWRIHVYKCDFIEAVRALELQLVTHGGPNPYRDLQSMYSEWPILRIRVELCPLKQIRKLQGGMPWYFISTLAEYTQVLLPIWEERGFLQKELPVSLSVELTLLDYHNENAFDPKPIAEAIKNKWLISFEGTLEWRTDTALVNSTGKIKKIVIAIQTPLRSSEEVEGYIWKFTNKIVLPFSIFKIGSVPVSEQLRERMLVPKIIKPPSNDNTSNQSDQGS